MHLPFWLAVVPPALFAHQSPLPTGSCSPDGFPVVPGSRIASIDLKEAKILDGNLTDPYQEFVLAKEKYEAGPSPVFTDHGGKQKNID